MEGGGGKAEKLVIKLNVKPKQRGICPKAIDPGRGVSTGTEYWLFEGNYPLPNYRLRFL